MSSTTFISGTLIESSWLNDVNTVAYRINTGTGSTVLATSPTIVSPTISSPTISSPTVNTGNLTVSTGNLYVSAGKLGVGTASPAVTMSLVGTDAALLPVGTTAQRPTGSQGYIRFNTSTVKFEGYNGSIWASVGGGATGGGSDQIFIENGKTVNSNYTITTDFNAGTFGPVSVASGVTVTIPTGSVWSIV